jgi:hypothetical protein
MNEGGKSEDAADRRFVRWRWTALVVAAGLALGVWLGNDADRWRLLGVPAMNLLFADTAALLAAGEAHSAGIDPYRAPNYFDPGWRAHIYGPGWLVLGDLGLTVDDTPWLGALVSCVFFAAVAAVFRPRSPGGAVFALLALFSPPVLLGLNRANNDLIMVVMLLGAAWLAGRRERTAPAAASVLLGAAALLKIYPLAAWPALWALPGRGWRWARVLTPLAVAGVFAAWQWPVYAAALSQVPADKTIYAYAAGYAAELALGGVRTLEVATWVGTLSGLLLLARCARGCGRAWWELIPLRGPWAFIGAASACIWSFSLLVASNYPYRAVWLLPLVALAWRAAPDVRAGRRLAVLLVVFLWSGLPMGYLQWRVWAIGPEEQTAWWAASIGFAQCLVLVSLGVALWLLTGWSWRMRRRLRAGE